MADQINWWQFTCSHLNSIPVDFLSCYFNTGSDVIHLTLTLPNIYFDLHQASSSNLTREQKYTVDRMVEAYRLYRAQDSSHCRVRNSVTHWLALSKPVTAFVLLSLSLVYVCLVVWVATEYGRRGELVWCRITPPAKTTPVCQDSSRWNGTAVGSYDFLSCTTSRIRTLDCSVLIFSD